MELNAQGTDNPVQWLHASKVTEEWIIEMQTSQNLIDMESMVLKGK